MNENVNNTTNLAKDNRLGIFMFFIDNINAKTKRSKDYKEKRIHYGINVFKLRFVMTIWDFTDSNVFNAIYSLYIHASILIVPLFGAIALARN